MADAKSSQVTFTIGNDGTPMASPSPANKRGDVRNRMKELSERVQNVFRRSSDDPPRSSRSSSTESDVFAHPVAMREKFRLLDEERRPSSSPDMQEAIRQVREARPTSVPNIELDTRLHIPGRQQWIPESGSCPDIQLGEGNAETESSQHSLTMEECDTPNASGSLSSLTDGRRSLTERFLKSEELHVDDVYNSARHYIFSLRKADSLSEQDVSTLLDPIIKLCDEQRLFLQKVETLVTNWDSATSTLGDLILSDLLPQCRTYIESGVKDSWCHLIEKLEEDEALIQRCQEKSASYTLPSLYYVPVQRLWDYEKYIRELLLETQSTHPDFDELHKASARTNTMVKQISEPMDLIHADIQNEYRLEKVQNLFPNDDLGLLGLLPQKGKSLQRRQNKKKSNFSLSLSPQSDVDNRSTYSSSGNNNNRFYVMEGAVQLNSGDRHLFLFSDLLLVAKANKSNTSYKLKHRIRVSEIWISDCVSEVSESNRSLDTSFVIGWPTTNVVATFSTAYVKDLWLNKLKEFITTEKMKEVPKTVALKIYNPNSSNGVNYKCVTITNVDTAAECVQKSIALFEINPDFSSSYRLWVKSSREDVQYPLIGHEQPYSILMSHIRDKLQGDDLSSPLDLSRMTFPENQMQCQFILKESKKPNVAGSPKKNKRIGVSLKRSPAILWPKFKKSPGKDATPPGKLFGHCLPELSPDGSVPPQIMGLLGKLFQEGPYCSGIFRKTANVKHRNELKHSLDSGLDVNLNDFLVFVVAACFMDFCRNLPDCLLVSGLYFEWSAAVDEDDYSRLGKFKEILEKLPRTNYELLRHFVCVLWHIDRKSEENKMNANNLSICIGPSLLWPPRNLEHKTRDDATKKVPLCVQFMIEKSTEMFGENVIKLFGDPVEPIESAGESMQDSDSTHSLQDISGHIAKDNSSVDSLDHELYTLEIPNGNTKPSLTSPTNLSRDSGLTLSDQLLFDGEEDSERDDERQHYERTTSDYLSKSLTPLGYNKNKPQHGASQDSLLAPEEPHSTNTFIKGDIGTLMRSPSGGHLYFENSCLSSAPESNGPMQRLENVLNSSNDGKMFFVSARPRQSGHHKKNRAPSPPPRRHRSIENYNGRSISHDGVLSSAEVEEETSVKSSAVVKRSSTREKGERQSRDAVSRGSSLRSKSEGTRAVNDRNDRSPSPQVPPRHKKRATKLKSDDPPVYIPTPDYHSSQELNEENLRYRKPSNGSGGYFSAESDVSQDHSRSNSANSGEDAAVKMYASHAQTADSSLEKKIYEIHGIDLNQQYESNWAVMLDRNKNTRKEYRSVTPDSKSARNHTSLLVSSRNTPRCRYSDDGQLKSVVPPGYDETLSRMSSDSSPCKWVHDKNLASQTVNSMRARLMYEDSVRTYQREKSPITKSKPLDRNSSVNNEHRPRSQSNIQIPDGTYRAVLVHRSKSDSVNNVHGSKSQHSSICKSRPSVSELKDEWQKIRESPRLASLIEGSEKSSPPSSEYTPSKESPRPYFQSTPINRRPVYFGNSAASKQFYYGMDDPKKSNAVVVKVERATSVRSRSEPRPNVREPRLSSAKREFYYGMDEKEMQTEANSFSEYGGFKAYSAKDVGKSYYYYGMDPHPHADVKVIVHNKNSTHKSKTSCGSYGEPELSWSVKDLRSTFEKHKSTQSEYGVPTRSYRTFQDSASDYQPSDTNVYYTYKRSNVLDSSLKHRNGESYV